MTVSIYLLLDTSASMNGAPLQAMLEGYETMTHWIEASWESYQPRYTIIRYGSQAEILYRYMPITGLNRRAHIDAAGSSALGRGLQMVATCWNEDQSQSTMLPLSIIFTDGAGTDHWSPQMLSLREAGHYLIVFGCGVKAKVEVFRPIVDKCLLWQHVNPMEIQEWFRLMVLH